MEQKRAVLNKMLNEFIELFSEWEWSEKDYCLGGELSLRLNGYPIKYRDKHFDFFVNRRKIPWKVLPGEVTFPPVKSKYYPSFRNFLNRTDCDPHFVPIPLRNITPGNLAAKSQWMNLGADKRLRLIKAKYQIINYCLAFKDDKFWDSWPEEKINRWISYFEIFRMHASRHNLPDIVRWCDKTKRLIEKNIKVRRQTLSSSMELKGIVVFSGKVVGKARIIFSHQDLNKVKKGNILVASYATSTFIKVLDKAIGIVTDQSGLLSHAAIISRENQIPCIIGTHAATKVLKDGDLVEVDAERGVVKLLKKAK